MMEFLTLAVLAIPVSLVLVYALFHALRRWL
jgi:hypothetical protein